MSNENAVVRTPRIHGELLKLGIEDAQSPWSSTLTAEATELEDALRNHAASIASPICQHQAYGVL
jgi:hypothetical protein